MENSIVSYPERGPWGKSSWRGNASGHFYVDLYSQLRPRVVCDPMVGSGTSRDVAMEMGIEMHALDLHSGFNAVRDSILQKIGKPVDLCFSHPPYGSMIVYSGEVWGDKPHPDDLSRCVDDNAFHERPELVMLNQRDATKEGGYYGCLIGDGRRQGRYTSYQAEIIARMPSDELAGVIIKAQHNTVSDRRQYARMALPRIMHEYALLFKRRAMPVLVLLSTVAREQQARLSGTWRNVVRCVLMQLGGKADLRTIYEHVAQAAPEKLSANPHWQDKIRQTLNSTRDQFKSDQRGVWALA